MDRHSLYFHHVHHSGANTKYYLNVLSYIHAHSEYNISVSRQSLSSFIKDGPPQGIDVLSYQTFPDESNKKKFNGRAVWLGDSRFRS